MKQTENNGAVRAWFKKLTAVQNRRKLYSALITLAAIVGIILVNVATTALEERFPLTLDLTAEKNFSLTTLDSEHEDFIRGIDYPVQMTLCIGENDIESGLYSYYLNNSYLYQDGTDGKYQEQMVALLQQYPKLNPNISLRFSSPLETAFTEISGKYESENFQYGDVLLECSFTNKEGKEINRYRILNVEDLYKVEDESGYAAMGYGYYTIAGSTLEPSVTQALYAVTQETSLKGVIFTGHGCDPCDALVSLLKKNNYEFSTVSNLLTETPDENAAFLVLNGPQSDFTNEEIATIQKFLEPSKEHRQKSLVYIPYYNKVLDNMEAFLEEWDIQMSDSLIYADGDKNYFSNFASYYGEDYVHLMPFLSASEEGSVYDVPVSKDDSFAPCIYRAVNAYKTAEDDDTIISLLGYQGEVVGRPISTIKSESEWTPAEGKQFTNPAAICVATDYTSSNISLDSDSYHLYSNVVCVATQEFFTETALTSSYYANGNYAIRLFNNLAAVDESDTPKITFTTKTISTTDFSDELSDSPAPTLVRWCFFAILPVGMAVVGFVICIRRKRR